jgi:predicted nucleic acid-binding protein
LIAVDTNILVYTEDQTDKLGRRTTALNLMEKLTVGGHVIPCQVFAEFINACTRKKLLPADRAIAKADYYAEVFETPPTTYQDLIEATKYLADFNLQYFDAVIIAVSSRAGAVILLSEDMHDGLEIGGLRIVNPFVAANETLLADYFAGFP